jgi:hypothetical protein
MEDFAKAPTKKSVSCPKARGQILVLMALLSTTLIIFFGMVISVGHLIQARINLQNAVDFAALVGASYQARYLNAISILNYRLRQNYKFVLADLYVTQSRFNKGFKDHVLNKASGQVDEGLRHDVFGICQQYPGYRSTDAVEGKYGGKYRDFRTTDMCKFVGNLSGIPHILWTPVFSPNPIVQALSALQLQISQEVKNICEEASGQNKAYSRYILNKLKENNEKILEDLDRLISNFSGAFSKGKDLGFQAAEMAIRGTFWDNLISANLAGDPKIEYLNSYQTRAPNSGGDYFKPVESVIRIRYVDFKNIGGQCKPVHDFTNQTFQLGVTRTREGSSLTDIKVPLLIALRASVRPRLLFWPQGLTPKLVAVSAAKPFGARIGPPKDIQTLELTGSRALIAGASDPYANVSFFPGDLPEGGKIHGFGHIEILKAFYSSLQKPLSGEPSDRPGLDDCSAGNPTFTCMALSPSLWEGLMWSIFPNPPVKEMARGLAELASYPIDFGDFLSMNNINYTFEERGASGPATAWHAVKTSYPNLGDTMPRFYANQAAIASAFNPEIFPPNMEKVREFLSRNDPSGRSGYQVKLISIREACEDFSKGNNSATGGLEGLAPYCGKVLY